MRHLCPKDLPHGSFHVLCTTIVLSALLLKAEAQEAPARELSGCFAPWTLVTLGDGSRKPLSDIVVGSEVLSWNGEAQQPAKARVRQVHRVRRSNLMQVSLEDGSVHITATADHPFWSARSGGIVSMDPPATRAQYGLETALMAAEELFANETGHPVQGSVQLATTNVTRFLQQEEEAEVLTLCLDEFHWFFVHGVRVHNKGCFLPSTPVSRADGSRVEIGSIQPGDSVLSWDEGANSAAPATVLSVSRFQSENLMDITLGDGQVQITSTPNHPYWSHAKQHVVSRDPNETHRDYGLPTLMMDLNDTFADEAGAPVAAWVRHRPQEQQQRRLGRAPTKHEVITLCLDRHHWFFAGGIRVHNKGCFVPGTPVTLENGDRKAIGTVAVGDVVLSWDEDRSQTSPATVLAVKRVRSSELMKVLLEDGVTQITSTPDHPYWSHAQQQIVSMDPAATEADYSLPTGMMSHSETFVNETGHAVRGVAQRGDSVRFLAAQSTSTDLLPPTDHEVVTLCLDKHHWFYVHGIRVHNKGGCFLPSTLVTLADGSAWPIGSLGEGDRILSWDESRQASIEGTVASVLRRRSSSLMEVTLADGVRITSTADHPFWSHGQQRLVSLDPTATGGRYGLPAGLAAPEETLADSSNAPVRASVRLRDAGPSDGQAACPAEEGEGEGCEVVTLSIKESPWFFVHGVRVHNKGSVGGTGNEFCCCTAGYVWNAISKQCEACPLEGLAHQGEDCYSACNGIAGTCPFCGTKGKCCRSNFRQPQDLIGPDGCAQYEGGDGYHVCIGSAAPGIQHEGSDCFLACGQRGGRCAACGPQGFCCRAGLSLATDLLGEDACLPSEGDPEHHICVSRTPSCDRRDLIYESRHWWSCGGPHQVGCNKKSINSYCCCDKGLEWINGTCTTCYGDPGRCQGTSIIPETKLDGVCRPSFNLHACSAPFGSDIGGLILFIVFGCCFAGCFCFICKDICDGIGCFRLCARGKAVRCKSSNHGLVWTTAPEQAEHDSTYREGWYCDGCGRFTAPNQVAFLRCEECAVDFCEACAEGRQREPLLSR